MQAALILLHPGPIPHPEVGSGSSLILGLFLGVALTAAGWVTVEAIAERRAGRHAASPRAPSTATPTERPREQLVVGRPIRATPPTATPGGELRSATDEGRTAVSFAAADGFSPGPAGQDVATWRALASPIRLVTFVLGILMGLRVTDAVETTAALARFAGTESARLSARAVYGFTVLIFVGAALVVVAPRAAAVSFGLAGLLGALLGTSAIWSDWIGGFDAARILGLWSDRLAWAGAAFLLALLSVASVSRRGARRDRRGK